VSPGQLALPLRGSVRKHFKVVLAMRSRALPHVDTLATYRVVESSERAAISSVFATADREGMPVLNVRRVTVTMVRVVEP
jgi:hypothetical protein